MRSFLGVRTLGEVIFLIAVPVVTLAAGSGVVRIVAASTVAYLVVLGAELVLARRAASGRLRAGAAASRPAAEPAVAPAAPAAPEPVPAPADEAGPGAAPEAARDAEPQGVLAAGPEPEPEPEPEPPAVEVEQAREATGPEPVPEAAAPEPRRWNVWELDRICREAAGLDPERDEERGFVLLYLRECAGPDGLLPPDFDGVVRDAFADVLDPD
jgi:hypothetical protein